MTKRSAQADFTLAADYVLILLELLQEQDIAAEAFLDKFQLDHEQLQQQDARVHYLTYAELLEEAMHLTRDPGLGLQLGAKLQLNTHGFLGYAAMSSETLADAIELAVKYFQTRTNLLEMSFFIEQDTAVLQFDEVIPLGEFLRTAVEIVLSGFFVMGKTLVPGSYEQQRGECRVTYARPDYFDRYESFFEERVVFEASHNQIRFPADELEAKLGWWDPKLAQMAVQQCESQLAKIREESSFLGAVKRILSQQAGGQISLEKVAAQLAISSRTLKRRLQEMDTSYQRLLDTVRKGKAIEYLTNTSMTVDEIAEALGYSDPSNFGRAFRKWTGKSPTHYRDPTQ